MARDRAEHFLTGRKASDATFREAAEIALTGAVAREHNHFKIELAKRTIVRAFAAARREHSRKEILMSASKTVMTSSTSVYTTPVFWERLWRTSGIQSVGLFVIAYAVYGYQPQVGASADALVAFYDGGRTRILIAAVLSGLAVLNLM